MSQKFLFLYLNAGSGHISCAKTIAEELSKQHPGDVETVLVDALEHGPSLARFLVVDYYRFCQCQAKWLFACTYALGKLPFFAWSTMRTYASATQEYLEARILTEKPDKIVIFHSFLLLAVRNIIEKHSLKIPVFVCVTDPFTGPRTWFYGKGFEYVLFSKRIRQSAIRMGIPSRRCHVFPYIVGSRYSTPPPRHKVAALKHELGFVKNKRLILIIGGGDGIPNAKAILTELLSARLDAEYAIVCGKSDSLKQMATAMSKQHHELTVYGFVDFVYELLAVSDFVITKGGPATLFEILLMGKIPIVNSYIWEQEKGNAEFITGNRLGFFEDDPSKLAGVIRDMISNPKIAHQIDSRRRTLQIRNGTPDVAAFIFSFRHAHVKSASGHRNKI